MPLYGANPIIHQIGSFVIVGFVLSPLVTSLFLVLRRKNLMIL